MERRYQGFIIIILTFLIFGGDVIMASERGLMIKPSVLNLNALKGDVEPIMGIEEEELKSLISEKAPLYEMEDPSARVREGKLAWEISKPERLYSKVTGIEVYPNPEYFTGVDRIENPLGAIQEYPYYSKGGRKYYLEGARDALIRNYFFDITPKLAWIYHLTNDKEYARKAAIIIARYAQVYPGYPVSGPKYDSDGFGQVTFLKKPPYPPYRAGKLTDWYCDEIPRSFLIAYDIIKGSGVLQELSQEAGYDIEADIKDFFKATVKFVLEDTGPMPWSHNIDPYVFENLILIAAVLEDETYVRKSIELTEFFISQVFAYDGVFPESPSYAWQVVSSLRSLKDLILRYKELYTLEEGILSHNFLNQLEKSIASVESMTYPDGSLIVVGDTWPNKRYFSAHDEGKSMLFPGYGYGFLSRGAGDNIIQVHLNFSYKVGHAHADALNIILWAKEKEMLADIGYTYTKYRPWTTTTLSHNTLLVDGKRQSLGLDREGTLVVYDALSEGFQVIQARAEEAYMGSVSVYKRALGLVGVSEEDNYVVDIFEVEGGKMHDWVFHGGADEPERVIDLSLDLSPKTGTLADSGQLFDAQYGADDSPNKISNYYGIIDRLQVGRTDEDWTISIQGYRKEAPVLKAHILGQKNTEIFVGRSPSVRLAKEDPRRADAFFRPTILLRRKGKSDLKSRFVVIWEPYKNQSFIDKVEWVDENGVLCIGVSTKEFTDYIFYGSTSSEEVTIKLHGHTFKYHGSFGKLRIREGTILEAHLISGTLLEVDGFIVKANGDYVAPINVSAQDGVTGAWYFEVDGKLPQGAQIPGSMLMPENAAGKVFVTYGHKTEELQNKTRIWLSECPGFTYERPQKSNESQGLLSKLFSSSKQDPGINEVYYPKRLLTGDVTLKLPASIHIILGSDGHYSTKGTVQYEVIIP